MGEAERGEAAPRVRISFWCSAGTRRCPASPVTRPSPTCGTARAAACRLARTRPTRPPPPHTEPYKTHLAYVKERRNDTDGAAILAEALARLRKGA